MPDPLQPPPAGGRINRAAQQGFRTLAERLLGRVEPDLLDLIRRLDAVEQQPAAIRTARIVPPGAIAEPPRFSATEPAIPPPELLASELEAGVPLGGPLLGGLGGRPHGSLGAFRERIDSLIGRKTATQEYERLRYFARTTLKHEPSDAEIVAYFRTTDKSQPGRATFRNAREQQTFMKRFQAEVRRVETESVGPPPTALKAVSDFLEGRGDIEVAAREARRLASREPRFAEHAGQLELAWMRRDVPGQQAAAKALFGQMTGTPAASGAAAIRQPSPARPFPSFEAYAPSGAPRYATDRPETRAMLDFVDRNFKAARMPLDPETRNLLNQYLGDYGPAIAKLKFADQVETLNTLTLDVRARLFNEAGRRELEAISRYSGRGSRLLPAGTTERQSRRLLEESGEIDRLMREGRVLEARRRLGIRTTGEEPE